MKYAQLEEQTNKLSGWYTDDVHNAIPLNSILVEDEIWQVNQSHMEVKTKLADHEDRIRSIELDNAANSQTLTSTRKVFDKVRDLAIAAAVAAIAAYYGMGHLS